MTYDPSGQQPNDPHSPFNQYPDSPQSGEPYTQYPDSAPPQQQPTSGGYYPQQPGYDAYQQPGYQQPAYQQPTYQASGYQTPNMGYVAAQQLPQGMAVTSLVLGIVSIPMILCCWPISIVTGIAAVIFGFIGTNQVKKGEARGQGMAMAGLICGAVGIILFVIVIVLYLAMGFSGFYSYSDYSTY